MGRARPQAQERPRRLSRAQATSVHPRFRERRF